MKPSINANIAPPIQRKPEELASPTGYEISAANSSAGPHYEFTNNPSIIVKK